MEIKNFCLKRVKIFLWILIFLLPAGLSGQRLPKIHQQNHAFQAGETIQFLIHYGPINGGTATLILGEEYLFGRRVYHAVATAKTTGITDKIFRVHDVYESFFDMSNGMPLKSVRNIHEGNYKRYNEALFNHEANTVTSMKSGVHKVPANILDMVSSLYYLRRLNFNEMKYGTVIDLVTFFSDEIFPFQIRYRGTETINTQLGTFNCLKFVPVVEKGRIFKHDDDMTIWLSNDSNMIPIQVKFEMWVGSFKCDLVNYSNLKRPLRNLKK